MTANGKIGYGVTLTWNGNPVAELTKVGGVSVKASKQDVTTHDSANSYKEAIPGLLESEDVAIEGNFYAGDTLGQIALLADVNSRTSRSFTVTFPVAFAATWTGTAYITGFSTGDVTAEGVVPFTATMMITGKPTLNVTASANLSNLVLTTATLIPTFAAGTYAYAATTTGTSYTVTPTGASGVITVNGSVVTTATPSSAISTPSVGIYALQVVVTETGKISTKYNITVTKTA